jgi:hypothetical protein
LQFESGFEMMQHEARSPSALSAATKVHRAMFQLLNYYDELNLIASKNNIKPPLSAKAPENEEYPGMLALCVLFEDTLSLFTGVRNYASTLASTSFNKEKLNQLLKETKPYLEYENLRLYANVIGFLASGKPEFSVPVQTSDIRELVESVPYSHIMNWDANYSFSGTDTITAEEYYAILRLEKNASRFAPQNNGKFHVRIADNGATREISVQDNGSGVKSTEMGMIFGTYTSNNRTGLGLQFVKRIASLRKGYAEVISTMEGESTYRYDPFSMRAERISQQPRGTAFNLYLPKH